MNRVLPPSEQETMRQLHKNVVMDRGEKLLDKKISQQRKEVSKRVTKEIENQKKQMLQMQKASSNNTLLGQKKTFFSALTNKTEEKVPTRQEEQKLPIQGSQS